MIMNETTNIFAPHPQMHEFSRGEIVAAIQAMMIYTIMRLVDSGREYFVSNRDMFNDMKVGPLSPTLCTLAQYQPSRWLGNTFVR